MDSGGLALCGCRRRPLLTPRGWLVDECRDDVPVRHRRSGDGDLATRQARCACSSLRSRQPIHQRAVPEADDGSRRHLLNEPFRKCLGQRGDGELLLLAQDGAHARKTYRTRDEARADVFDYIECFYNVKRRHSTIGYMSPVEFEMKAGLA